MTLEDLLQLIGQHPGILALALLLPPLLSAGIPLCHDRGMGDRSGWRYAYAALLYAACIPGMFSSVLTGYALFFRNESLLKVNLLVYILPIAAMLATLLLLKRGVHSFDNVPGFGRLSGLMAILGISFGIAFALHRSHFGILFLAPLAQLAVIAGAVFGLLQWGARRATGSRRNGAS